MQIGYGQTPLTIMIPDNENIMWHSKPYMPCFILESIFNPLLPFALLWGLFDAFFITTIITGISNTAEIPPLGFIIPFFALHLMPVWIYLGGVLLSYNKYKNAEFFITDKAIYISSGVFGISCRRIEYKDIREVSIERGFVDQRLGVGDVVIKDTAAIQSNNSYYSRRNSIPLGNNGLSICDIYDYQQVYKTIMEYKSQYLV